MSKALLLNNSNEWYTPAKYIEAARTVMNGIELDPASCEEANTIVKAERYYTEKEDGLRQPWQARSLWLNPPFGKTSTQKSNTALWVKRLIHLYEESHVQEAVMLVNNHTESKWFQPLWKYPICFTDHRINFYPKTSGGATFGGVLVYFGTQQQKFIDLFIPFGIVITPNGVHRVPPLVTLWDVIDEEATA